MKKYTDDQIQTAFDRSPKIIRDALSDCTDICAALVEIERKSGLPQDKIFVLSENVRDLLIGVVKPTDFKQALLDAGIPEKSAQIIPAHVNEKIYTPLRDAVLKHSMQNPREEAQSHDVKDKSVASPATAAINKPKPAQVPLPSYAGAPPLQSPRYIRDDAKVPEAFIAHAPQGATMPRQAITLGVERPSAQAPQAPAPVAQEVQRPVPVPAPMPMPRPVPPPQPVPQHTPAQSVSVPEHRAELPIGEAEPQRQAQPIRPVQAAIPTPPPAPTPPPQAPKPSYSADPYREPLDEKGA